MASCFSNKGLIFYLLSALFLLGLLFRIWHLVEYPPQDFLVSDAERHWENAQDVLAQSPMASFDPLLYQVYLSTVQRISGGIEESVLFFSIFLSLFGVVAWYLAAREIMPLNSALIVGIVLAFLPSWVSIHSFFFTETLFLPLLGMALWSTFRATKTSSAQSFMVAFIFWLLTALTRGIGLPLGGVALLFVWVKLTKNEKLRTVLYSVAILAPLLIPLSYRNWKSFKFLSPFGNTYQNQAMARTGSFSHQFTIKRDGAWWHYEFDTARGLDTPLSPFSDYTTLREGQVKILMNIDDEKIERYYDKPVVGWGRALQLIADDTLFVMLGVPWPEGNKGPPYGRLIQHTRWIWVFLFAFVIVRYLRLKEKPPQSKMLMSLIVCWFIVQNCMLFIPGQSRYRKPFEGMVVLTAMLLNSSRKQFYETG